MCCPKFLNERKYHNPPCKLNGRSQSHIIIVLATLAFCISIIRVNIQTYSAWVNFHRCSVMSEVDDIEKGLFCCCWMLVIIFDYNDVGTVTLRWNKCFYFTEWNTDIFISLGNLSISRTVIKLFYIAISAFTAHIKMHIFTL